MLPRILASVVVLAAVGAAPAASLAAKNPETDRSLGPAAGAGHYLPGQSNTFKWHGCSRSDVGWYPVSLLSGQQTTTPSTHRYVTFTVNQGRFPYFSWKAKAGYSICGAEAFATLSGPTTKGTELLAWASYKSLATSGSTAVDGRETVRVHMPARLDVDDQPDLKVFEGQTVAMSSFQAIAVYVKKKG
jgi:hypothetical protein